MEVCDQVDVLVNNAGLGTFNRRETENGFEMTMGVNHLGHFYLTYLLWPLIKKADQPRVINVSSHGHRGKNMWWSNASLDFDDFHYKKGTFSMAEAYTRSKIANILFTRSLQKKMDQSGFQG